jgi:hypothetical protein
MTTSIDRSALGTSRCIASVCGGALAILLAANASADTPVPPDLNASCRAPSFDMAAEIKAFQSTAENLPAGLSSLELPPLEVGRLYVLKLGPQSGVQFLATVTKKSLVQNPLGGLAQFNVPSSGNYRLTVDSPLWIDVVASGAALAPSTYNGWHSCRLFRKTVEYALQAGTAYVLQLSEATPELVRIVIEPAS